MTTAPPEKPKLAPFPQYLVDKASAESHPLSVWFNLPEEVLSTLPQKLQGKIDHHGNGTYAGVISGEDIGILYRAGATNMCHSRAGIPRPPKD